MMRLEQRGAVAFNAGGNDGPLYSLCPVDQGTGTSLWLSCRAGLRLRLSRLTACSVVMMVAPEGKVAAFARSPANSIPKLE